MSKFKLNFIFSFNLCNAPNKTCKKLLKEIVARKRLLFFKLNKIFQLIKFQKWQQTKVYQFTGKP